VNSRCCSRTACKQPPVYTLTFVYRDSTAVLGPLSAYEEPNTYDLCEKHAARLVAPRGWDVVRLPPSPEQQRADDLEAIANVVREPRVAVDRSRPGQGPAAEARAAADPRPVADSRAVADSRTASRQGAPRPGPAEPVGQGVEVGRRGHLRVLRSAPTAQSE
jgi:Protein of unknown function (DUF3499)